MSTILALSPHNDDAELGAGGTIARFLEEDKRIIYIAFFHNPKEVYKAVQSLGIPSDDTIPFNFKKREFPDNRQAILDKLIDLGDEYKPNLVLCPSSYDVHQDHKTLYEESIRAFKTRCSIWGYEHPWNNFSFKTDVFVRLEDRHLRVKCEAIEKYQSQQGRPYLNDSYIWALARVRGNQVNYHLAEAFEMMRQVI